MDQGRQAPRSRSTWEPRWPLVVHDTLRKLSRLWRKNSMPRPFHRFASCPSSPGLAPACNHETCAKTGAMAIFPCRRTSIGFCRPSDQGTPRPFGKTGFFGSSILKPTTPLLRAVRTLLAQSPEKLIIFIIPSSSRQTTSNAVSTAAGLIHALAGS